MDIRDRVMGDKPNDFLHKIAGVVPGFNGYMDRERRRDADKLLRVYLAHQYSDVRARITRVQQTMVRGKNLEYIAEVDRIAGVLQRFIDRLTTATYGYSGLFDPVKVEGQDLDMLYAFDMALTTGVDQASSAVGVLETAASQPSTDANAVPAALDKLASLVDDLNNRLNQRQDFISTGQGLPKDQYDAMLTQINQASTPTPPPMPAAPTQPEVPSTAGSPYMAPSTPGSVAGTPSTGAPTMPMGQPPHAPGTDTSGQMARVQGSGTTDTGASAPETPRTTAPDTYSADQPDQMGVIGVIPPVEQWQGIPGSSTSSTGSTTGAPTMPTGDTASTTSSAPATSPSAPAPSGTASTWSSDAAPGTGTSWNAGAPKVSDSADDFGMSQGSATGGNYTASGATDTGGGIQSAAAPSLPGDDLADATPMTGASDNLSTGSDSDLDTQTDDDLNSGSNL